MPGCAQHGQGVRSRLVVELAADALRAGDAIDAERRLRLHLLRQPSDAGVLEKLAAIALDDGRIEEAALLLRRAAAADPSVPRQLGLARMLLATAGPAVVLAEIESMPAPIRSTFELRVLEALLLGMVGQRLRQLSLYEALAAERPRDTALWISMADAMNAVGRTEEAVAALRRAIRINASCGAGYWALANLKSFVFADRDIAAMRRALRGRLGAADRPHFEFALGMALEQRREFEKSFQHYSAGNSLRAAGLERERMQVTGFVDSTIALFSRELLDRHAGAGCSETGPIFVVGLHRSGSTLVEQILASHPRIEGCGELPVMQQIRDRLVRAAARSGRTIFEEIARWDSSAFEAIGAEYLERTRPFRLAGRPWFVDKLPANWLNLGLILAALPNARIIDTRRHPMACGFSNFKQLYGIGVTYSYSLEFIGRFYRDYLRLMRHFDAVRHGAIHHVVNERLVEDPEREVRRMLGHVGVPFDPACLDFHRNERAVHTPSAGQVRRPINRDGLDAWRAYEPWLGPLKQALGEALDDWLP